ncbi:hypothetical protein D499_0E00760 [Hanseniaspora uvarum DSM 2768]|nr:hypothetical protein D499_0E00760 [Hanseniaspora uvarum DSM 2768]
MNDETNTTYTKVLDEIKWDTNKSNITHDSIEKLKELNTRIGLNSIEYYIKSFKIKYTYFFTSNNDIPVIINYIKEYINNNMSMYLYLSTLGLEDYDTDFYIEAFITEIANIFEKKLININHENIIDIIHLDLFFNNEFNVNVDLLSRISHEVISRWINFEIVLINDNYAKNFDNNYFYNVVSSTDLVTYLTKLLKYFNGFLLLKNDNLFILKNQIKIFQKIILNLILKYRQNIVINPNEDNIALLKNIIVIYDYLLKLNKDAIIININKEFKQLNDDNDMVSLLEGELIEYKKLIIRFFNNNVVVHLKNLINRDISNYIPNYSEDAAWNEFFEKNKNMLAGISKTLSNNSLLTYYFIKLDYINTSLIIKKVINNVVLNGKLDKILINKLTMFIGSLNYCDSIIEFNKFKDYTELIGKIHDNHKIEDIKMNYLSKSEIKDVVSAYN